ncbi:MAG: hypothetical protein K940chlam9_00995 [Chlamydiae bacterium]|nr:hypothetical protein [Chlamydiota bacterium]
MINRWLFIREVVGAGFLPTTPLKLDAASRVVSSLSTRVFPGASLDKLDPDKWEGHRTTKDFYVWILGVADGGVVRQEKQSQF